ncbi:MAG: S46 family peptidase [Flavobacteriales bacterium]|nr:S46 family peptidase [Flavobacteriales bacterium]
MKIIKTILLSAVFLLLSFKPGNPDEGMYLLSQISTIGLNKAGLKIPVSEVYNPGGIGLIDALVRIDGCTGSFVSDEGLIITNHHCAFGAAAAASTPENNYIDNGFYAPDNASEIKTRMTCKITQSYADVSERVLKGVRDEMSFFEKSEIIKANGVAIIKEETEKHPQLTLEISEMSTGKIYTLFRYKVLNDIRLVYVPPRTVGEFGGETDNWVWPRHNADFSFVRAYENNEPYKPKKHLEINFNGVKENDFAFILGYPGRTYRHQPYKFLEYQKMHTLPFIADWYEYQISSLQKWAGKDEARNILVASYIKRLANTSKNFKGKIQGLTRTNVIKEKYEENEKLKKFVSQNPVFAKKYSKVIPSIDSAYDLNLKYARRDLILKEMYRSVSVFFAANFINNRNKELTNIKGKEAKMANLHSNKDEIISDFFKSYRIYDPEMDQDYLLQLLLQLDRLPEDVQPLFLKDITGKGNHEQAIEKFVQKLYRSSKLKDNVATGELIKNDMYKFFGQKEAMMKFAQKVSDEANIYFQELSDRNDIINALMPLFTEIKMNYYDNTFIPDANATLRLTYGYIKGYSPEDAVYNHPFTYLKGILEKANTDPDYKLEDNIIKIYKTAEASDNLKDPAKNDVVVGMLYNMDTTGGNSGSPILDADGKLIGVNFDRAYTATINDYAWNEEYSRSIGVDIRFVLYVMKNVGNTNRLLDELGAQ